MQNLPGSDFRASTDWPAGPKVAGFAPVNCTPHHRPMHLPSHRVHREFGRPTIRLIEHSVKGCTVHDTWIRLDNCVDLLLGKEPMNIRSIPTLVDLAAGREQARMSALAAPERRAIARRPVGANAASA